MGFESEEKEEIRDRTPIEDLVREYNVQLQPSGRGFKALCPFHSEKTPSFTVNVESQFYHCFGCKASGDIFAFVQKFENVDFPQAIELLARRAGVELKRSRHERLGGGGAGEGREKVVELYDALSFARDFYHRLLIDGAVARSSREYLTRRGLEKTSWKTFELGFSPSDGTSLFAAATQAGLKPEVLERAGLIRRRDPATGSGTYQNQPGYYDYFRGRLMFPITNLQGRTVGFGARALSDRAGSETGPKYLNTPKTPVFDKSRLLYGLKAARATIQEQKKIAICEGYTDVIMAHQSGLRYFVASLGTAFTVENARQIARLAPSVWLLFDGDSAGQKASERSLELLVPQDVDVRIHTVPNGQDPCEALQLLGGAEFQRCMDEDSVGLFEFKWRRTVADAEAEGPAARGRALDECLSLLSRVPNVVTQSLLLREFSERIGVDEKVVSRRFAEISRDRISRERKARSASSRRETASSSSSAPSSSAPAPFAAGPSARSAPESPTRVIQGQVIQGQNKNQSQAVVGTGFVGEGPSDSTGEEELARTILECLLALPQNAAEMLDEVPKDLFQEGPYRELVEIIKGQLRQGGLAPERLLREVESGEAQRHLINALSLTQAHEGSVATDYQERWLFALRDIGRHCSRRKIESLTRDMEDAKRIGDGQRQRELMRARFQHMKLLKQR